LIFFPPKPPPPSFYRYVSHPPFFFGMTALVPEPIFFTHKHAGCVLTGSDFSNGLFRPPRNYSSLIASFSDGSLLRLPVPYCLFFNVFQSPSGQFSFLRRTPEQRTHTVPCFAMLDTADSARPQSFPSPALRAISS